MALNCSPVAEQEEEKNLRFLTKNVLSNQQNEFGGLKLPKSERLCRETTIRSVFEQGKSIPYEGFTLFYFFTPLPDPVPAQILFSAPKKPFRHAWQRNRVKRLMREAYRPLKASLYAKLQEKNAQVALLIMYKKAELPDLPLCQKALGKLLLQLENKIPPQV